MFLNVETQKLPFILFFWHYLGGEGGGFDDDAEFILTWDDGLAASPALLSCDPSDVKSDGGGFLGFLGEGEGGVSSGGESPCRLTPNPRRSSGGCSAAERGDYVSEEGRNREGFLGRRCRGRTGSRVLSPCRSPCLGAMLSCVEVMKGHESSPKWVGGGGLQCPYALPWIPAAPLPRGFAARALAWRHRAAQPQLLAQKRGVRSEEGTNLISTVDHGPCWGWGLPAWPWALAAQRHWEGWGSKDEM